jgi:predicted RNase H-like HicB family nuclease
MPVVIQKDEDGYFATCPALQGCYSQGATYEQVIENIRDAIALHIQDRADDADAIPTPLMLSVATVQVAA